MNDPIASSASSGQEIVEVALPLRRYHRFISTAILATRLYDYFLMTISLCSKRPLPKPALPLIFAVFMSLDWDTDYKRLP
jgi:hypothetical protein